LAVGSKSSPLSSGVTFSGGAARFADESIGNSPLMKKRADGFKVLARFIIYTIYPPSASEADGYLYVDTLALLRTLLQSIESFYHPSNSGRWTSPIVRFLQYLCETLHERLIAESPNAAPSVKCDYDSRYYLTVDIRRQLVMCIRPALFLSMFGKSQGSALLNMLSK
jgi:proteasome activator subunit 4